MWKNNTYREYVLTKFFKAKWFYNEKNNNIYENINRISIWISNICNFSCIMCKSNKSTWRIWLDKKLWMEVKYFQSLEEKIVDELKKIKNLKDLKFKWWEPFLDRLMYKNLDWYIKNWVSKNINLIFITNLSVLPWINWFDELLPDWYANVFDIFNKFKYINIWVSCDWIWESFEQIRIWWKWEIFDHNLKILKKNRINININCTIQNNNIFQL